MHFSEGNLGLEEWYVMMREEEIEIILGYIVVFLMIELVFGVVSPIFKTQFGLSFAPAEHFRVILFTFFDQSEFHNTFKKNEFV